MTRNRRAPGRQLLCLLLAVLLLCSLLPVSAAAAEEKDLAHFDELYQAVRSHAARLDTKRWNYTHQEMSSALHYMLTASPELYYCLYEQCLNYNINGMVSYVEFAYDADYAAKQAAIDKAVRELKDSFDPTGMADWEIALAVHEYLIAHAVYAADWYETDTLSAHPEVYNMYGILGRGKGVCAGYCRAYMYLLKNVYGIDCVMAISAQKDHAWNLVKLDGAWYHVDVSSDDPIWDTLGYAGHKYFLLNDAALLEADPIRSDYRIVAPPAAEFRRADGEPWAGDCFWQTAWTNCCYYMKKWYYIDYTAKQLRAYSTAEQSSELLLALENNTWPVYDQPGWSYRECYSRLMCSGSTLYFSTASDIRAYHIESRSVETLCRVDVSEGYVYGFGVYQDGVGYALHEKPNNKEFETILPLTEHFLHTWGSARLTQPATYDADGASCSVCTVCGESKQDLFRIRRPADVPQGSWYEVPVEWAMGHSIAAGTGTDSFSPDQACTRAQLVTFLWRSFGCPAPQSTASPFVDVADNAYYRNAVLWSWENGILQGLTDTTFGPDVQCTRAMAVTILYRAFGQKLPAELNETQSFGDVDYTQWYGDPVRWAAENSVVNGLSEDRFAPQSTCSRAMIVTLLYRIFDKLEWL